MAQHTQGNIARRGEFVDRDLTLFSRIRIWGQLIRLPNLFIVLLTQYFIYYILILPAYRASSLAPQLDGPHFALLVLTTILIAAGGYIINDIKDRHIDQKNRPDRLIIGPFISLQTARMAYWLVGLGGLGIALYLAIYIDNLPLVLLYPSAVFLLWWYSHQLKRMPLWGNLIVSLFCAFVAGIVWFAERHGMAALLEQQPSLGMRTQAMLLTYLIFAFVSTLYRELIKDMEDIEGDRLYDCRTFPIAYGMSISRRLAWGVGLSLLLFICAGMFVLWRLAWWADWIFAAIALVGPLIYSLVKLRNANSSEEFHHLSRWAKWLMLSGLLYLLFFYHHLNH